MIIIFKVAVLTALILASSGIAGGAEGNSSKCNKKKVLIAQVDKGRLKVYSSLSKEEAAYFRKSGFSKTVQAKFYRFTTKECEGRK